MGHARRRRGAARGRPLSAHDFDLGDGVRPGWDGDGTVATFAEAQRHWEALRVEAWQLWAKRPSTRPPRGAQVHDGLERIEDIAAFRERQPRAAAAVGEYLDLWVDVVERHRSATSGRQSSSRPDGRPGGDLDDLRRSQQ